MKRVLLIIMLLIATCSTGTLALESDEIEFIGEFSRSERQLFKQVDTDNYLLSWYPVDNVANYSVYIDYSSEAVKTNEAKLLVNDIAYNGVTHIKVEAVNELGEVIKSSKSLLLNKRDEMLKTLSIEGPYGGVLYPSDHFLDNRLYFNYVKGMDNFHVIMKDSNDVIADYYSFYNFVSIRENLFDSEMRDLTITVEAVNGEKVLASEEISYTLKKTFDQSDYKVGLTNNNGTYSAVNTNLKLQFNDNIQLFKNIDKSLYGKIEVINFEMDQVLYESYISRSPHGDGSFDIPLNLDTGEYFVIMTIDSIDSYDDNYVEENGGLVDRSVKNNYDNAKEITKVFELLEYIRVENTEAKSVNELIDGKVLTLFESDPSGTTFSFENTAYSDWWVLTYADGNVVKFTISEPMAVESMLEGEVKQTVICEVLKNDMLYVDSGTDIIIGDYSSISNVEGDLSLIMNVDGNHLNFVFSSK